MHYDAMHVFYSLLDYIEQFGPKHWLAMLIMVVVFGYMCFSGLGRSRY